MKRIKSKGRTSMVEAVAVPEHKLRKQKLRKPVAERIRQARLKKGLTQQQLANDIGVTLQAVRGYEKGQWEPSRATHIKLATVLEVPLQRFNRF